MGTLLRDDAFGDRPLVGPVESGEGWIFDGEPVRGAVRDNVTPLAYRSTGNASSLRYAIHRTNPAAKEVNYSALKHAGILTTVTTDSKPKDMQDGVTSASMTKLSERIELRLAEMKKRDPKGKYGPSWLARRVGVSAPAVSKWLSGNTGSIKSEHILAAAKALGVRPEWLISGKLPIEDGVLSDPISTRPRPVVVVESHDQVDENYVIEIPRYTVKASAGGGMPILEIDTKGQPNYCRSGWVSRNGYRPGDLFSIVASGDSMEPTIPNGASLIVHRQTDISPGRIHVICRGGECFVKRLVPQLDGSVLVRSDNRDTYRDVLISADDPEPMFVVGLVVSMSANL